MVQRDRKQKVKKRKFWFHKLGASGIIQSLIVHIFVLMFLALSFTVIHKQPVIKLSVNFDIEEDISIEPIAIEMPQPEISTEEADILTDVVSIEDNTEIHIDILENLTEITPSIPVENISAEILNTTMASADVAPIPKASTTRNSSSSTSDSLSRFNALMKGKLDDRLTKHGANFGDIQVSISWDDYNDIDLWVEFEPFNFKNHKQLIGWTNRESASGGYLDIDMNVQPFTNEAVENVVWPPHRSPYGTYTVYAHYYFQWDRNNNTQVYLRVNTGDQVIYRKAMVSFGTGPKKLYTFTRRPSKIK